MNRKVTISLGVVIVIVGFGIQRFLASQKTPPARSGYGDQAPTVLARVVSNTFTANEISISGKLMADKRIEIFSEVQGVLLPSNKVFKEGVRFAQGERMLRIDSTEFYLNLMATKSSYLNMLVQLGPDIKYDFPDSYENWNAYVASIDVTKPLPELPNPTDAKQKNFLTSRDVYNQYFMIKSQEEKLTKYNLKAPFGGVLSEGNLQPGTMIRAGQKLGALIKPGSYELEAALGLSKASHVSVGDSVLLYSSTVPGEWIGRVKRVSEHLDNSTQTVKVYISLSDENLKEGMFLSGRIISGGFEKSYVVPRNLLIGTDQLFVIKDSNLVLTKVEVLSIAESEVVIRGVEDDQLILGQVFSGAYNGLKVAPKTIK